MRQKLSGLSRILLMLTAILVFASIFVPIWRIELDAPQYPEGLVMQIYANKLGGQVEIINGLNHYIGMATLHADDFVEFTVLPYILGAYALLIALVGLFGNRRWLLIAFIAFALFGVVAMVDFWRWEYEYGHNLDPNAAIVVPGMAYQPPLIGFKQLLNFGAYSIPDIGGWFFIAGALLMGIAIFAEFRLLRRNKGKIAGTTVMLLLFSACSSSKEPVPIKLNSDQCDYCKMIISDEKFCAELLTGKGRAYKFDDISCLVKYTRENTLSANDFLFVADISEANKLNEAGSVFYVRSNSLKSPMAGNTVAFSSREDAQHFASENNTEILSWEQVSEILE